MAASLEGLPPGTIPPLHLAKGSYFSLAAGSLEHIQGRGSSGMGSSSAAGSGGSYRFRHLVYPLPEPGTAGLGTHLTLDLAGGVRFGPDVEWLPAGTDPRAIDYSVSPARAAPFYAAIRAYLPGLPDGSLEPSYAGVRPKVTAAVANAGASCWGRLKSQVACRFCSSQACTWAGLVIGACLHFLCNFQAPTLPTFLPPPGLSRHNRWRVPASPQGTLWCRAPLSTACTAWSICTASNHPASQPAWPLHNTQRTTCRPAAAEGAPRWVAACDLADLTASMLYSLLPALLQLPCLSCL